MSGAVEVDVLVILIFLDVLRDYTESFTIATLEMAHTSLREKGCRRFEVIRDETVPTRFVLSMLFNSRADGELHLLMQHHDDWQTATASMLSEPPQISTYTQLF